MKKPTLNPNLPPAKKLTPEAPKENPLLARLVRAGERELRNAKTGQVRRFLFDDEDLQAAFDLLTEAIENCEVPELKERLMKSLAAVAHCQRIRAGKVN